MNESDAEAIDQRLALNLRTLRESKVMSQATLAREMTRRGVQWHQQTVGRVEAGRQPVRVGEAVILAAILDVPLERLTSSTPESDAMERVLRAGATLGNAADYVANMVRRLLASRTEAEDALTATKGAPWPKVQTMQELLIERLDKHTLEAAVAEGIRRYEEHGTEEGGVDAT